MQARNGKQKSQLVQADHYGILCSKKQIGGSTRTSSTIHIGGTLLSKPPKIIVASQFFQPPPSRSQEFHKITMGSKPPTWDEQWGNISTVDDDKDNFMGKVGNGSGKMARVKSAASSGLVKAKAAAAATSSGFSKAKEAATSSAEKVKDKTSVGIKWIKNMYQKKSSK